MTALAEAIRQRLEGLTPAERELVEQRLRRELVLRQARYRFPTPGHLAQFMRPHAVQTPMLDAVDRAIMSADSGAQRRWIINTPPQEGKTTRLQDGALWMLLQDPTRRIGFASYEQGIAQQSGLAVRQFIETYGGGYRGQKADAEREDVLGLTLDPARGAAAAWSLIDVPGRKQPGGIISVGVGSALTGRPLDVLIVDDPLKDAKQADSPVMRRRVQDWYQSVAGTRLSSRAIVIVIQTRWHEHDLSGWLLELDRSEKTPQYAHLSIPAQAEENDPLGRRPGEWLVSARGRTVADWEQKRKDSGGGRWWFALYQQRPAPPDGGVFKREWFTRVGAAPEMLYTITVVDPADNDGDGDEAGVVTGGLAADGRYAVLADDSGHYTVAGWARKALFAALKWGSSSIRYEQSLSGLKRALRAEWKLIRQQARTLHDARERWRRFGAAHEAWPAHPDAVALAAALEELGTEEDTVSERKDLEARLAELWPHVPAVLALPVTGVPLSPFPAKGSKLLRAEFVAPLYENRMVLHVGHFPTMEHQMTVWQPPQDSPDRMDAVVHLLTLLSSQGGPATLTRPQGGLPTTRSYSAAGQGIQRTTAARR